MKLRDLGEFPFLRRLRDRVPADPRVFLGLGDDCAVLSLPGMTLLTTDAMIEGVHFRREWTSFSTLGEKAFAVNASDIAAMGGEPTFALLSLGVPQQCEVEDLDAFFNGFVRAAEACGTALIGGNMSAAPCLMLSVTLLGQAPHGVITRSGAQVGDDLYVTGTLGDAALGLRLLQEERDGPAAQAVKARFLCPSYKTSATYAKKVTSVRWSRRPGCPCRSSTVPCWEIKTGVVLSPVVKTTNYCSPLPWNTVRQLMR